MRQFLIQSFVFITASLLSVGLIFVSQNYQFYQQLIPLLLVLDIVVASRVKSDNETVLTRAKLFVLLISSLLVQTIVISSGGFYSPLLILLHIFTLGAILILSSSSPIIFLTSSLGALIFHISFDRNLNQFFKNDPWAVAIYALSIVIVIPLALYLSHSNSIKSKFNSFLRDYIQMSEKRQKSILTALSNMVIVTDRNLNVVSINIAVERLFRVAISQVQGKPLSEFLILRDTQGEIVPFASLPVQDAIKDKATHITEGYFLETKIESMAKPITLQIRPLTNQSGDITQIVFVLTDPLVKIGFNTHPNIAESLKKRDQLLNLITNPQIVTETSVRQLVMLITHIEEDILTVQEMEDHPLQDVIGFVDLVTIVRQIIAHKSYFYMSVGNIPEITFDDEDKSEAAFLNLNVADLGQLNPSKYTAAVDSFLLKLIIEKILDISVVIAGNTSKSQVYLSIIPDNVKIDITFPSLNLTQKDIPNFYIRNYPGIKLTQLQKTSGLEGYIAGRISRALGLPVETTVNIYKKTVTVTLIIQKQAKIHTANT